MNTATPPDETAAARSAKVLYTAKAHGTGVREGGESRTSDGRRDD